MAKREHYFLPYTRQGVGTLADHSTVTGKRMVIPVQLTVQATNREDQTTKQELVEKDIHLFGPGDVLGIGEQVISRLAPAAETQNFEATLTPFIEFSEPDFLWRFSSSQTSDSSDWIPWLTLIILKAGDSEEEAEFTTIQHADKALPSQIQLTPDAVLPDLRESWRWAHVHMMELENASQAQLEDTLKRSPEKAVCRLLSPRKLKPMTRYHAFLVPTFQVGAEAAMGITDGVEDRTLLTWETPAEGAGKILPYYYDWAFTTGTAGDFEYLVRKLKPQDLEDMGVRPMDCSNPGYGMEEQDGLTLQLEAALRSMDTQYQSWGMDSSPDDVVNNVKQAAMAELLNKREEVIGGETKLRVTPPVYGEWYAGTEKGALSMNPQNRTHWVEELNLDFRHRAAAGLGVQFVRENQETLMKAAWQQLSKVKKVNQELNLGRFGREVSARMYKRLNTVKQDDLFKIALPLQNKIAYETDKTINAYLKDSAVTNNLTQPKIKKYMPSTKGTGPSPELINVDVDHLVSKGFCVKGLKNPYTINTMTYKTAAAQTTQDPWVGGVVDKTKTALDPKATIETRIKNRINPFRAIEKGLPAQSGEDELHPVKWYPEFHRPMYRFLRNLSQEHILPGLEDVPQNTVGLLQTNRRFIEAFMVGLNHEMASELRWREFPTDMRGSYFRSFWDTSIYSVDQTEKEAFRNTPIGVKLLETIHQEYGAAFDTLPKIEAAYAKASPTATEKEVADAYEAAIEKWLLTRDEDKDVDRLDSWNTATRLGDHPVPDPNNQTNEDEIVLLVRGELLQKFSNTLIYLAKRDTTDPTKPDLLQASERIFPVFEGAISPDVVFIGFPISKADVADYFVIFEERMTELRFGLDQTPEGDTPGTGENDFSWEHFQNLPSEGYLDGIQPTIFTQEWEDAAYISKVMLQKQVRVAVELQELLPDNE